MLSLPSADRALIAPLEPEDVPQAAGLLAQGTAFSPEVMARIFAARAAAGSAPTLLAARSPLGGRLLGAGLVDPHRPVAGGRLFARAAVAPGARGRGTGRALVAALLETLPGGAAPLSVEVDLADRRSQAFAERCGGVAYQRSLALELDLLDPVRPAGTRTAVPSGLTVQAVPEHASEQQWREAFAVYASASLDLPDRAGAPEPSWEMFRAQTENASSVLLARRHGEPVGISAAVADDPEHWYVLFTGTLRPVRRSGVARALKTALHQAVQDRGGRWVSTSTLDVNVPMLTLNAAFGYRRSGGVVRFQVGRAG